MPVICKIVIRVRAPDKMNWGLGAVAKIPAVIEFFSHALNFCKHMRASTVYSDVSDPPLLFSHAERVAMVLSIRRDVYCLGALPAASPGRHDRW